MKLRDPRTGEVRDFDPQELHQRVLQEGYEVPSFKTPDGVDRVRIMGDGRRFNLPVNELPSFLQHFSNARLTTEADDWIADPPAVVDLLGAVSGLGAVARMASGPGGGVAAQTGAASGATLGLSDALLAAAAPDLMRGIRDQHGGAHLTGELGAILASSLLSGGSTLAAQAPARGAGFIKAAKGLGGVAGKATAKSGALPGIGNLAALLPSRQVAHWSNRIGAVATRELFKKTAKMGPVTTALAQIGARGMGFGALGGAESALWTVGAAMEEKALGDPRELGEILSSDAKTGALLGFLAGGAIGAGGALYSSTVGQGAQRVSRMINEAARSGDLLDQARATALDDIGKQLGLSTTELRRLQRSSDFLPILVDDTVLADGSVIRKKLADGTSELVRPTESVTRMSAALSEAAEDIGIDFKQMQDMTELTLKAGPLKESAPAAVKNAIGAYQAALKAGNLATAAKHKAAIQELIKDTYAINADNIARSLEAKAGASGFTTATDSIKSILRENAKRFDLEQVMTYDDLVKIRGELRNSFKVLSKSPPGDINANDMNAALREVWHSMDDELWRNIQRADGIGDISAEAWKRNNKIYKNLVFIEGIAKDVMRKGGPVKELSRMFDSFAGMAQGRMNLAGAAAVQRGAMRLAGPAGLGAAGGIAAASLGAGPLGAVVGGATGVAVGAALRHVATPKAYRVTELAMKVAQNQQLLQAADRMQKAVERAVHNFVSRSTTRAVVTPIIGAEMVHRLGGDKDTRKAAARIRQKTARLMNSPNQMAAFIQHTAGPLQAIHPETGAAYAEATMRQLAAVQVAIQKIPRQPGTIQPALSAEFQDATDEDMERFGLSLAAIAQPELVIPEIMAGMATQDQIDAFRVAHPAVFAMLLRAVARRVSMHQERLTGQQQQILASLGLGGAGGALPGIIQRNQMGYQQEAAGVPAGGPQPGPNNLGSLQQTANPYSTRETRRRETDAQV